MNKKSIGINKLSMRQAALISGWGLLLMTISALYAFNFIFPNLIVSNDAALTVENIATDELRFRIGICCLLLVIVLDVLVAWALYFFLRPIHASISLLAAWFRLVYAAIFAMALTHYFEVLQLLKTDGLNDHMMRSIGAFSDTWAVGFIFFGLHLSLLGYLTFKSGHVPKILAILLIVAGLSYLIDYVTRFLFPENPLPVSTYLGWGELIFMFWLLFRGGRARQNS